MEDVQRIYTFSYKSLVSFETSMVFSMLHEELFCITICFLLPQNRQRAQEMWNWIYQLESEKFDLLDQMKRQKYEVWWLWTEVW